MTDRHAQRDTRPPARDGVSPSRVIVPAGYDGLPLSRFLARTFPVLDEQTWEKRIRDAYVLSHDGSACRPNETVKTGNVYFYYRRLDREDVIPFRETILFENDFILVADKPHFLPVTPSGEYVQETLLTRLRRRTGIDTLTPAHRIDRETAGLVLFTKRPEHRDTYQGLFRTNFVSKQYDAIAPAIGSISEETRVRSRIVPAEHFMQMAVTDGKPNSETVITPVREAGGLSLYRLKPVTGRKHQLRVQMAHLGAPILNDRIYPELLPLCVTEQEKAEQYKTPLALVAKTMTFTDPLTQEKLSFVSDHSLTLP